MKKELINDSNLYVLAKIYVHKKDEKVKKNAAKET
jgi:hypothetical protein